MQPISYSSQTCTQKQRTQLSPFSLSSLVCVLAILYFWFWGLRDLTASPILHNDEVSIFAAGWQLIYQGQYGLAMYAGFFEQESLYLEILPLMSLLQGVGSALWGAGVLQMRFLPVVYGAITVALTYRLGGIVANKRVAAGAVVLLLFWQWAYPTPPFLQSGILLMDLARIGRYDILIAPLSLLILLFFLRRSYILCGFCLGLSLLTHLYVIFWLPIIACLWWLLSPQRWRDLLKIYAAGALTVSPWVVVMALNWSQTLGQMSKHGGRFSVTQVQFYLTNLITEVQRYHLGLREPATFMRFGFWLLVIGAPLTVVTLQRSKAKQRWAILVPICAFALAFALLISKKNMGYLLAFMPMAVVAVAWQLVIWWQHGGWLRTLLTLILGGVIIQGFTATLEAQRTAHVAPSTFFSELRQHIPPNSVVMGPQTYWVGLFEYEFRSHFLPFVRAMPERREAVSFGQALDEAAPTIFIWNDTLDASFRASAASFPAAEAYESELAAYLDEHDARIVATLQDHEGLLVTVYQLK